MSKKHCIIAAMTLLAALNGLAASGNWTNDAASVWSAATNWSSNPTVPGTAAGDTVGLTFDITAARTVTIDSTSRTVGTLNIGDPGSSFFAYTLAASGGATLTFDNSGSGALLSKPTAANTALDVISAPITLADNLTIDTEVAGAGNSGNSIQFNGVISESGSRSITKNGVGGLYLTTANTYSGGTILNAGEIQFSSGNALGTGPLTINGGSLAARSGNRTIANAMTIGGDFTFNSADAGGNALTSSGNVDLGAATRTITVASTANPSAFMTGIISSGNPSVGLIKAGGSVLNLSGLNTFSGDTRIAAGSLQLSTNAPSGVSLALQNSTVDMNAADAGTLSFRGATTVAATLGGLKGSRNLVLTNTSGAGVTLSVGNNGQNTTYSGVLSGTGGKLTKIGTGTLTLSGANSYDSGTSISGGIINVQNSFGFGTNGTVTAVNRNSGIQVQGGINIPAAVVFTLSNDGTSGAQVPCAIENVSGNNTINGTLTLTSGGGGAAIQSDSGALVISGILRIASGQSSRGFTLQGVSTAANTISGPITNGTTGVNSITKNGTGNWTLSGTNLYFGPTIVNGGTLFLSGSGSISNSPVISVASGGTFDVSGLSSTFVLNAGQSISNSVGTVNGSVATVASSSIYPATAGTAGTLTFNSNLNLSAGGTALFDLDISAGGANDQIVVGGNLTLSSSDYVHINAMSGSLDTADYVLFSVSTGTTMATTPVLVWDGSVPVNSANYSLQTVGNNVVLHYSASTAPSVTASVNPTSAARNQPVLVTATVTKGSGNVTSVTVDLTAIGGSATAGLVLDSTDSTPPTYIYTNTFLVSAGTTLGNKSLTVVATDDTSPTPLSGTYIITPLTITVNAVTWDGGGSDDKWTSNANWTSDIGPALIGDSVTFSGIARSTPDMNTNYSVTSLTFDGSAGAFTIGSSTGSTLTSGGITNNSSSAQTLNVSVTTIGAQTFNAAAGNLTFTTNVNLGATVTIDGTATTTISGLISGNAGIIKVGSGTLVLPNANNYGNNGANDTLVNGGILSIGNDQALGTSRLNLGEGSTVQSADSSARVITNTLNFGGGTTFAGTGNLKFTRGAANSSPKTMTVNNPVTEFSGVLSGNMSRTIAGTGLLIFSGANTYSQGTTINSGANLQLGNGSTNGSLSTSGVIDVEGTLIFNRSDAIVQGTHFSSAPIVGGGSVVQAGSGTTTLNAANTYSGSNIVNNGELFITPAFQGGGNVLVASGANFGISASSASNSATIGNLTLNGPNTLDFAYNFGGNPTNAVLAANAVTVSGACTIRIAGSLAVGTFPVLKYNSLSGSFVSSVVGPRGVTATVQNDSVNKVINVVVSSLGSGIVWTGTNSISPNIWDVNTTTNWLIGGSPTVYLETVPPGDAVTFNDSGSGSVLLSNTVGPSKVTFNNSSVAYTIQGSGQINSAGGLTKVGTGTVTLNVPGTFSSGTVLSNGAVSIGANQTFANLSGNSAVNLSAGTPTLTVNESSNTTFVGNISGATLTKTGNSVLTLTSTNSLTGNLFVSAGGLTLDSGFITANSYVSIGHSGTDTSTLTLKGTANFTGNNDLNAGDTGSSVGTINIQDSASVTVNAFYVGSANASGSTASGTVNQTGGTVRTLSTTAGTFSVGGRDTNSVGGVGVYNLSSGVVNAGSSMRVGGSGVGTFNQSGGSVTCNTDVNIARLPGSTGTYNLDGGTLYVAHVTSSTGANATFNMNGGVLLASQNNATIITNIPTVNVRNGGAVIDTTNFSVTIYDALQHSGIGGDNATDGGLTKRGNGTLTLADSYYSSYTGPTFVAGGALNLYPNSVGNLNNLIVSNAELGLSITGGSATFNAASLKLAGNSALNLNYDVFSSTPPTTLNVSGSLTVSGTTTINVFGYGWMAGQQVALVDYTGTALANLNNFTLGSLPYGVAAYLSNNVANTSIDLVITSVSVTTWIPLAGTDPVGVSSFNAGNNWQDFNPPSAGNDYLTRTFALRSPADANAYSFAGSVLSVDVNGRFIMKGTGGQVLTVNNLIINGGLVDYANSGDNLVETLAGNITLQAGLTSYIGALGSSGAAETLIVAAPIGGSGNLQFSGSPVSNAGTDLGVVILAGTNTYTGATTVGTGTLLINGVNGNSPLTVNSGATLGGTGTIGGTINVLAGGTLAPGTTARGAQTNAIGTLTGSSAATVSGGVTMKINRDVLPKSDKFVVPGITANSGATLTVNNIGSTNLAAGDMFTLFGAPVSGAFSTVTLPTLPSSNLYWTNNLAVNGSIAVVAAVTVNTNPTNIIATVNGNTLMLSWPADHLGWHLQVQNSALSAGLGTNWVTIPGSDTVTSTNLTINPAAGSVFYRMVYP